ncbi:MULTISPECIES: M14 family metallopeptidase [Streptomyces]|uniref:Zinc carboxypeptidase n=1 Tax=Streptomyces albus (strain ATCC 21838 / DSM 41398 / FERM P-419 / JCM 4703 / NBRC 107858) TaxID=1081613 RepID=A0A0B5EM91_STRA4|nr:M14 family metallopeptidase [Streptomyces sp. SCSIO ZS0520]AJE83563.1 peptidase M14 carboxypeptidase A [Streptomyces albus]AOU77871.1 peptidase M14 carboxypeptidase A [Streptomyces albus]AYN33630.1 zinc carboxypeptidase [Streptomyces albus]
MRLQHIRGRRTTAVAALLTMALAVPIAAQATEDSGPHDSAAAKAAAEIPRQYRVTGPDSVAERDRLARLGVSLDEVAKKSVVITADSAQLKKVRALGWQTKSLGGPPARDSSGKKVRPGVADFPSDDSGYHTYDEALKAIDEAVAAHPDILSKQVIGKSHEGRDLLAVKISDNVKDDEDEPEVLFTHHQHAREHLTVEMALYLIDEFGGKYGSDEAIKKAVDGREIWIVPDLNPDGGEYDITGGEYQMWRKNRQPNEGSQEIGTDQNRNWDFKWGCCGGSSEDPGAEDYRGAAPESAPEVKVVSDFVRSRVVGGKQQITAAIDFHTYGELVMWPWGWTQDEVTDGMTQDDIDTFKAIGKDMAASNDYTPQQDSALYTTDGAIDDYLWGDQKIFAYTYEMYPGDSGSDGFYPPDEVIEKETARNRESVLKLLDNADCMYKAIGKEDQYCK